MWKRLTLVVLLAVACGGSTGGGDTDAGQTVPDSGEPDAGAPDAGAPDAGAPDAGQPDAGQPDAGQPDAGAADAGQPDAGDTVFCHFTVTGQVSAKGDCDGVGGSYETAPDAFFVETGTDTSQPVGMNFGVSVAGMRSPATISSQGAGSWDFEVFLPSSSTEWSGGSSGPGVAAGGTFVLQYTSVGTPRPTGSVGTTFIGTHGTLDAVLQPFHGAATSAVTVHIDF